MANIKTCVNGHNYDADKHTVCPYCPENAPISDYEKTLVDFKKTQMINEGNSSQFNKTVINEETSDLKTTPIGNPSQNQNPLKRTSIATDEPLSMTSTKIQIEKRKIVGWLVTFTHDDYGQDYKLYMGKNKIGSAPGCDITIGDSSISNDHATILYRDKEFLIKDNFSTNGTKINGTSTEEGKLKDGDEIQLGNTLLKFKSI